MISKSFPPQEPDRESLCRRLGLGGVLEAHILIASAPRKGVESLLARGLDAGTLERLGYGEGILRKLGYDDAALRRLGFAIKSARTPPRSHPPKGAPAPSGAAGHHAAAPKDPAELRRLVEESVGAAQLHEMGVSLHELKMAEVRPEALTRIGFPARDLASVYTCAELRRSGFRANELIACFSGAELRSAGFSARDLRAAGFTIPDLRRFGFSDNHIVTAGFSMNDLAREGLSKRVVDKRF